MFELDSVVEAVLSSSTVTYLETNIPFQISSRTKFNKIVDISIDIKKCAHPLEMQRWLLIINFPFQISRRTKINMIGDITIDIKKYTHPLEMQRCCACLRSLAYFSRVTTSIYFDTIPQLSALTDCITIWNNSLHFTTRIFDSA